MTLPMPSSKADLHVYSKFSGKASDWVLRKLDFPASTTEPELIYEKLKGRGMQFVTLTDHHSIEGCQALSHKPDFIWGEEVTAYFPEDSGKVHLLLWGIDEAVHHQVHELRHNIYELQKFLNISQIPHAVAHPFRSLNDKLQISHIEKLVLLFRCFEEINGQYDQLLSDVTGFTFRNLTESKMRELSDRHQLPASHENPWVKSFVGGSDDHGGIFLGRAWTETPACQSKEEFLEFLRQGSCCAEGQGGTPLTLAHTIYSTAFQYAKSRLALRPNDPTTNLVEKIFSRFMEGQNPTEFTLAEKLSFLAHGIASGKIFELAKVGNSSLWKDLSAYFSNQEMKTALARETSGVEEPERRAFLMANLITSQLAFRFFSQFIHQISHGKIIESIQTISPLVPLVALLSPYLYAFRQPNRNWLRSCTEALTGKTPPQLINNKRAWFTDTLEDVNGVATTIRKMTAAGVEAGHDLIVATSRSEVSVAEIPIKNFAPIGEFELPEYELQRLSFPPILHILEWVAREKFSELIISTPGPVGLTALLAAKALGLRTVGIYHTDFPQYVRILTDDSFMETLTWNYMHWFYSQLDIVYVNSEDYRKCWFERGIPSEKLKILPRGLDTVLFHPDKRRSDFWAKYGLESDELGMLYVGRVSKEKNLDLLVSALKHPRLQKAKVRPLFVGDGPYAAEMRRLLPNAIFTGYLVGEDLAAAYASADFFAFPSTTDTFGNVILEAHASGLPTIVSDQGGPRDLVDHEQNGLITKAMDLEDLVTAIAQMSQSRERLQKMGQSARQKVEQRDWAVAFEQFWAYSPE